MVLWLGEACANEQSVGSASPNARGSSAKTPTALDLYVAAPDTNYSWSVVSTQHVDNYNVSVLRMNSQVWLTTNEVDRPLWQHWMTLIRPDDVKSSTALLFITGGSTRPTPPGKPDDNIVRAIKFNNSLGAINRQDFSRFSNVFSNQNFEFLFTLRHCGC